MVKHFWFAYFAMLGKKKKKKKKKKLMSKRFSFIASASQATAVRPPSPTEQANDLTVTECEESIRLMEEFKKQFIKGTIEQPESVGITFST